MESLDVNSDYKGLGDNGDGRAKQQEPKSGRTGEQPWLVQAGRLCLPDHLPRK